MEAAKIRGISNYRSIGKMEKNIPCRARPRGDSAGEGANGDTAGEGIFSKIIMHRVSYGKRVK